MATDNDLDRSADTDDAGTVSGNREAAKYRTQLREVEKERDQLRDELSNMRRGLVDDMVQQANLKPAAVWATGVELESLLNDDGTINRDAVHAAIGATRDMLGIPKLPAAPSADGQGTTGDVIAVEPAEELSWSAAITAREA
ncbi:hypothetical protein [Ruicaihuangia caeni]|uniref:Scaffolding protein n=1 Tax=Ruicaihuangia caeni TaxID=3042517 RepID=A0AAW6T6M3_9MICO|nr:hypothetical protein [Klugiella sp. YN-L-19]MDI2097999.1 hypothetical protein [Klugiella sp. YN-L-19]